MVLEKTLYQTSEKLYFYNHKFDLYVNLNTLGKMTVPVVFWKVLIKLNLYFI